MPRCSHMIPKMAEVPMVRTNIPKHQQIRYERIGKQFEKKYGVAPQFFIRAPGRVNLIGEHIDYSGYAVLPMAVEQDIVIATAADKNSTLLRLSNTNPEYQDYSCDVADVEIPTGKPLWHHYFMCGLRGITERYDITNAKTGMMALVDGTIPRCAGLSSSSALVCCAALATMQNYGQQLTKTELAEVCQRSERYIGTEGGGMDQAISFLAQPGTAKLIEFNPVRATDVWLPDGAVFVVSNSCVELNKAATSHFNTRVAECRLAAQVMAAKKGMKWQDIRRLGDLHLRLGVALDDMTQLVDAMLHAEPYSKKEVCDILNIASDELDDTSLNQQTKELDSFKLHDRASHVYSEAARVTQFKAICEGQPTDALESLGRLMNESHASCRDLYECSCPDLDVLVNLATQSGALGSRLTGAGWGGCAVSLVPANQKEAFIRKMYDGFYAQDAQRKSVAGESLFATQPGGGATIYAV